VHPGHSPYRALIGLLWLAWMAYWAISAANAKTTQRHESRASRAAHVLPLVLGAGLLGWPVWGAWLEQRLWPRSLLVYWVGVALLAAGLVFAIWARAHLGRNWSGSVTVKEGHELVRSGPYRWVRHPIYTGMITAVLGTAIASGTLRAALGLLIITLALLRKLRIEERFMQETFPDDYPHYRARVPGLIPFTAPRRSAPR
jgi:protein-S-isoprenylcysteine O-methyltransferase Ste14